MMATLLVPECPLMVMVTLGRGPAPSASTTCWGTSSPRMGSAGSTWVRNLMVCSRPLAGSLWVQPAPPSPTWAVATVSRMAAATVMASR
jgi:hypothetical protein